MSLRTSCLFFVFFFFVFLYMSCICCSVNVKRNKRKSEQEEKDYEKQSEGTLFNRLQQIEFFSNHLNDPVLYTVTSHTSLCDKCGQTSVKTTSNQCPLCRGEMQSGASSVCRRGFVDYFFSLTTNLWNDLVKKLRDEGCFKTVEFFTRHV